MSFRKATLFSLAGIVFATIIAACAALDIPTADTFNERLAVGYTTVTAVRQSATALLNAKQITADDGDNVLKTTDTLRAGLDVSRKLSAIDPKGADSKLTAVRAGLTALQGYLATKKGN